MNEPSHLTLSISRESPEFSIDTFAVTEGFSAAGTSDLGVVRAIDVNNETSKAIPVVDLRSIFRMEIGLSVLGL